MDKMAKTFGVAGVRYDAKGYCKNEWWLNAQKFINGIANVKWFDNHVEVKENWKVFDTYSAAWSAAGSAARSAARSAAWSAAAIISEDPIAIDYFNKVWEIWKAGYGYMWDKDGIFYVYKDF